MKKVVIIARQPEISHLLAVMFKKIFPECQIEISENRTEISEHSLIYPSLDTSDLRSIGR